MGRFTKQKKEEEESIYPKLTTKHYQEISELYVKFKSPNRILKHWNAVQLDKDGMICAVTNFEEWYKRSDSNMKKYEIFEPLKGIRYVGQGFYTFMPYNICREWLADWSVWIVAQAEKGDIQALSFMKKEDVHREKVAL